MTSRHTLDISHDTNMQMEDERIMELDSSWVGVMEDGGLGRDTPRFCWLG